MKKLLKTLWFIPILVLISSMIIGIIAARVCSVGFGCLGYLITTPLIGFSLAIGSFFSLRFLRKHKKQFFSSLFMGLFIAVVVFVFGVFLIRLALHFRTQTVFTEPIFPPVSDTIASFDDCVDAGYLVMESYPRQCRTAQGDLFVEEIEQKICDDQCGNGTCEEIVCLGEGCPCAETSESCEVDCKE